MFLNVAKLFRVAINGNLIRLVVFVILVFNAIIDEVEHQLVHIQPFLFLKGEHTFVIEQEWQTARCAHVAIKLVEDGAHVGHGARGVVGQGVDKNGHAVRAITFIGHLLIFALVFSHCVFNCALNVIFRHVFALAVGNQSTKRRVVFRFRSAGLYCDCYLLTQFRKHAGHVPPSL